MAGSERAVGSAGERSVLVVEDEPGVRLFMQTVLVRHGYAALAAGSAAEALQVAESHAGCIDLVISDLLLPDMNGRTLVGLLRQRAPGLPVVFISGFPRDDREPASASADRFMEKPFRAQDLLDVTRRAIDPRA